MKKLLIFLVLVGYTSFNYSQTLIQTFTDRCTGATQVFQIAMTGTTTVVFYNRAQTFTAADVQSGAFQAWLEETYLWWTTLNPCSAAQAESTTAQQTAQQTAQAATQAATSAASTPPPSPPTPPSTNTSASSASTAGTSNTQSTNESTTDQTTSGGNNTEGQSTGNSESESSGGQGTEGETSDNGEDTSNGEGTEEEVKNEEKNSDESSEEKSEEETKEEDSKDSDSEEDEEESSKEESDDEDKKEEKQDRKKKRALAPPILASNIMSMQMLDGSWSTAASFGVAQSSLTGQETYSANAMIWSNFKQFSLGLSKSKVHFWSEYEGISYTVNPITGKRTPARDFFTKKRYVDRQNQIHHVGSTSINLMYIYGTKVISGGYSHVVLGQNDNFWKGFAGGYATTTSIILLPESLLFSPAFTFFGTKPFKVKTLPRWGFAPMLALSYSPIQMSRIKNEYGKDEIDFKWNKYMTYIVGTSANFNLTQRFVANLGINTINSTDPIVPTSFAVTIGARFAF